VDLYIISFIVAALGACCAKLFLNSKKLNQQYKKLKSQKKSSEVRIGQIAEHFAPLLKDFKYDRKQARFLATPIDFIVFEEEEIVFLEVKTGNSQLNANQRRVKKQVEEKKVRWETLRIK
tara:strand:+ start:1372 stop:1731 length:360 start_codon:yes stop_codon:yes gene_type:complete